MVTKRAIAAPVVLTMALAAVTGTALPASASHDVTPARVAGDDRIATAAAVAMLQYPEGTDQALLAKAGDFPDALAGAPLASERGAPILLTLENELAPGTIQALQELGVSTVTILGGPDAVDDEVVQALRDLGYTVDRIFGPTRFETAAEITRAVQLANNNAANFPGGQRAVFLANGLRFPDALTASAPAAAAPAQIPILLVGQDAVPAASVEALQALNIELAVLVGGPEAISEDVRAQLEQLGINTTRVSGQNRMATATAVAGFAQEFLDFDADTFLLARGDDFPDALAAGPRGGAQRNPILLTQDPSTLSPETAAYLAQQCTAVQVIRAVGGTQAVTPSTLEQAELAAENCHGDQTQEGQTFLVAPQQPLQGQPGDDLVFSVAARFDQQPFTGPVDVALFPCESADVVGAGADTFADADADGVADALGQTDTGATEIVRINGEAVQGAPTVLRDLTPDDNDLDIALRAQAADCTVTVVFQDTDGDGQLDLDAADVPSEPYGVGVASWS